MAWTTRLAWLGLTLFAVALGALAAFVLVAGAGFYLTPVALRADHAMNPVLGSGSIGGLWLGILGTALMLAMLSYSVRKFLIGWKFLGSPVHWLRFHIICGIMGPIFILLHSGLKMPHGLIGIGFWCMVLVALSGVFGRYIYGHFPRTAAGRSEDYFQAFENLARLRAEVVAASPNASGESIGAAVALARDLDREAHSFVGWLLLDFEVRQRSRKIPVLLARSGLAPADQKRIGERLVDQLRAKRDVEGWAITSRLFRLWHLFHEPLAKAMYLIVALHVLQAVLIAGSLSKLFP
ncbi:MAG: hypothetical protein H6737_00500 [Alphaproteobacteria bacterium]|nr:hypothetical protein [Alphaproteobacteria bacterium]